MLNDQPGIKNRQTTDHSRQTTFRISLDRSVSQGERL